ncbi:MAG: FtsX-like permease family protein [Bacteroidales bacterium]|nr:FtsX-like permease family protein [Bacteroidales bacterium]MDY0142397.1 FtsX-like permease family protein [Bacteroidales bacterium]
MIKFIFKAILRDKNRSLLPVIIISIGVFLTIFLSGFLSGVMTDVIDQTARFQTGHVKVMSKAYAENEDQIPNDLALLKADSLTQALMTEFPDYNWVQRIRFGGLVDAPDNAGGSKGQGPSAGLAIDFFSGKSGEVERLNIVNALIEGNLPQKSKDILIGFVFADKLKLKIGDTITFMGSTMYGSLAFESFTISGIVNFGVEAMDRGTIIVDISDARRMLDMENASGEILGFSKKEVYNNENANLIQNAFNAHYAQSTNEYAPVMIKLKEQNNMASLLDYIDAFSAMFVIIFVLIMSVVLWNTGLIGGLRRYQEFGIRLALGENKSHIYKTLLIEAVLIGTIGSIVGTIFGITATWLMQVYGIDISGMVTGGTMMMPTIMRAKFTPELLYIGFIPGLIAMVLGNMISGIGIYKRETATLFKELEV